MSTGGCPKKKQTSTSTKKMKCLKCFKPGHWTFQCPLVAGGNDEKKQDWRKVGANILSDLKKKKEKSSGGSCRSGSCSMPSKTKSCSKGSCGPVKKKTYTGGTGYSGRSKSGKPLKKSNSCSGGSCSKKGGYNNYSSDSESDDYSDDDYSDSDSCSDYSDSDSDDERNARRGRGCRCGC